MSVFHDDDVTHRKPGNGSWNAAADDDDDDDDDKGCNDGCESLSLTVVMMMLSR